MSEEDVKKEVVTEETGDTSTDTGTTEQNPAMEQAISQGWKPKEEYTGDPDKWVDFEEFNRRAPFFEAISKANKKVKTLEEQLDALMKHHNDTREREYKRAKEELLAEKKAAAKDQDLERVIEIDEQLQQLEQQPKTTIKPTTPPELIAFGEKNEWYGKDKVMTAFANGIGADIERANPNLPVDKVLELVEKEVKENFPQKFSKPQVTSVAPSRHSPTGITTGKKKSLTYNDLPEEAKMIYSRLVKGPRNPHGIMTSEQYLKEYAANSGLNYEE